MKIQKEAERCDLCGKHRALGVTETSPSVGAYDPGTLPTTKTFVCLWCLVGAAVLLAGADDDDVKIALINALQRAARVARSPGDKGY